MLKPKGLGQDTLFGLSCGDVRASPVTPPGVLIFIFIFKTHKCRRPCLPCAQLPMMHARPRLASKQPGWTCSIDDNDNCPGQQG